jgi:hypothetical protein
LDMCLCTRVSIDGGGAKASRLPALKCVPSLKFLEFLKVLLDNFRVA